MAEMRLDVIGNDADVNEFWRDRKLTQSSTSDPAASLSV